MKLLINYDFYNAVRDASESLRPMKVIRNEKKKYMILSSVYLSMCLMARQYGNIDIKDIVLLLLRLNINLTCIDLILETLYKKIGHSNMDLYAEVSSLNLKKLVLLLSNINVSTNYNMLLSSELYYKTCHINCEERKLPILKSKKYIYVPSYGYDGEEKVTSILQEHIIGTKEYILSVDEPDRQYRRILVKSLI